METRRGNFKCAFCLILAFYVLKIRFINFRMDSAVFGRTERFDDFISPKKSNNFRNGTYGIYFNSFNNSAFRRVAFGNKNLLNSKFFRFKNHRKNSGNGLDCSFKGKFADKSAIAEVAIDLSVRP